MQAKEFINAFKDGLIKKSTLEVSKWAQTYRVLTTKTSARPGRWRNEITPYLVEIMDILSERSKYEKVVFMKPAQIGATEAGLNWLGYIITEDPGPVMVVYPTLEMAKRVSRQRIADMIENSVLKEYISEAKEKDSSNTLFLKEFPGGVLVITGANSSVGLKSVPVRYLLLDEIDSYPADVSKEGDPVMLAEERTVTFYNRKIFYCSTPTLKGISRIENLFNQSDKRFYYVPCPFCNFYQPLIFQRLIFNKEIKKVKYQCEKCGKLISESFKPEMLRKGHWIKTENSDIAGFYLNALYSPFVKWKEIAKEFLRSKDNPEQLKVFVNTVLAETFEEELEKIEMDDIELRSEDYTPEMLPEDILILTAGIDIQIDRIELEVVGWGVEEESWSVEYKKFWGDLTQKDIWEQLHIYLQKTFKHPIRDLKIAVTMIDSGAFTEQVYRFCKNKPYLIYPVKGVAGTGRPIISHPSRVKRYGINLFPLGTDTAKDIIFQRLKIEKPGPGFCHFSKFINDRVYFDQLTAERPVLRKVGSAVKRSWVKIKERNEALDCRIYAYAGLCLLNVDWEALKNYYAALKQKKEAPQPGIKLKKDKSGWISGL